MFSSARSKTGRRVAVAAAAVLSAALVAGCSSGASGSESKKEVVIGFALSQSGNMAPFDVEPGKAAMLRVDEINAAGGVNGKKIKTISEDVRSDPNTVGTAVTDLIAKGVNLLVLPCDFDLSAPGATAAQSAKIPAISICAGDPKMANTTTLGDYVFSANAGSDVEGATGAAWAAQRGWKKAYLLQDQSIEYTKSAGKYFEAQFKSLGGSIVGSDSFPGGDNVDVSSQILRLKRASPQPDFVYVASWNPGGATAIRQLHQAGIQTPIVGPAALDGKSLLNSVGSTAKDIYYTAFACYAYCSGQKSPTLDKFAKDYTSKYGAQPSSSYALLGYNMVSAISEALAHASSLSGPDVRAALVDSQPLTTPVGQVKYFSKTCHKIIDMPLTVVGVDSGKMTYVGQQRAKSLPKLGDNNSCAG
ncbi:ABC transporter substrate-binding protein [Actinoallomurus iriomotensis]|uniref:Branched-chain amino acid ABC transporter substrate-binding protein n=1 Tax=Actinoallomurus iriomotensis TaxID=478107 RepID=A0A9W6RTU1_9ACTN|nr:ABC transporter substrate-binding protein [Actinoallomurus iriomotensis]GLY80052.1 branched-chain amino acid ABC transporter substrate-binding protein [Actinoallomurus iriomotensis]